MKVPKSVGACGSHWYLTSPGVKFTVQVSWPMFATSVAQLTGGTHETDAPVRWKLCIEELSSTSIVYAPSGSVPPLRSFPSGSERWISNSGPTEAVKTWRGNCGAQFWPGGSCCTMRWTLLPPLEPIRYGCPQESSPNEVRLKGETAMSGSGRLSVAIGNARRFDQISPVQ